MNANPLIQKIDEKIIEVKQQLLALAPFHPGSLSNQRQVCGKPGCKCHDPERPEPHGPYCKMTYVYHGKHTCRFVRADCVEEVGALVGNYKTFRDLTDQWVALSIERAKLGPLERKATQPKHQACPVIKKKKRQN